MSKKVAMKHYCHFSENLSVVIFVCYAARRRDWRAAQCQKYARCCHLLDEFSKPTM